jgi:hypothetical protein
MGKALVVGCAMKWAMSLLLALVVWPISSWAQDADPLVTFPLSLDVLGVSVRSPPPLWFISKSALEADPAIKGTTTRVRNAEKRSEMLFFFRPNENAANWTERMEIMGVTLVKPPRHALQAMDSISSQYVGGWCDWPLMSQQLERQEYAATSVFRCADYRGPQEFGYKERGLTMVVRVFVVGNTVVWLTYRWTHVRYDPNDLSNTFPMNASVVRRVGQLFQTMGSAKPTR